MIKVEIISNFTRDSYHYYGHHAKLKFQSFLTVILYLCAVRLNAKMYIYIYKIKMQNCLFQLRPIKLLAIYTFHGTGSMSFIMLIS